MATLMLFERIGGMNYLMGTMRSCRLPKRTMSRPTGRDSS